MSSIGEMFEAAMRQHGDTCAGRHQEVEMMPRHENRIARDPRVIVLKRTRESVMLDVAHGRRFKLNRLGVGIWDALATEPTFGALVDHLWSRYDVSLDVLAHDVAGTLSRWSDAGLISWR
jgi:hypothetical protein